MPGDATRLHLDVFHGQGAGREWVLRLLARPR